MDEQLKDVVEDLVEDSLEEQAATPTPSIFLEKITNFYHDDWHRNDHRRPI